jgi:hypothetical protein
VRFAIIAFLLIAAGCYAFVPVASSPSTVGAAVQIALTSEGSVALTPEVGPSVATIEGQLLADSSSAYVLAVTRTVRRDGAATDWRGEKVEVPHGLISLVATRQLSRTRTIAFSALATGLLAAISEAFAGGSGGSVSGAAGAGVRTGK